MTKERFAIAPKMLTWALERAGREVLDLLPKFPALEGWLSGDAAPTLKQLEAFAKAVHLPFGYLFLPEPLSESLPVADFRTVAGASSCRPSLNLLDTVYLCTQRQDWFRDYARLEGLAPLPFVGSVTIAATPIEVAAIMRETLDFPLATQQALPNWESALGSFRAKVDDAGILLMANGVVGNNTKRKLQVEEFRGFALSDTLAPLIFINNGDSKAAQMFTLAHELGHLWLGESGISAPEAGKIPDQKIEIWCNAVAAEFLMPLAATKKVYNPQEDLAEQIPSLAKLFKVSRLVVVRRLFEAGFIDKESLWQQYQILVNQRVKKSDGSGGDFYRTLTTRTGKRFLRALVSHTMAGHTLFREAFQLLGVKKSEAIYKTADLLGVPS